MKYTIAAALFLLILLSGCVTSPPPDSESTAALPSGDMGGWMDQPAGNEDIHRAWIHFGLWCGENKTLLTGLGLPSRWDGVKLLGGGTQVVSGLNIRLDITDENSGRNITAVLYRDFSENYEIDLIEEDGEILYSGN